MTSPQLFLKRTSTVEAWQWDGTPECAELIIEWIGSKHGFAYLSGDEDRIVIVDASDAYPTDWIIRDKFGEFWPLGNDIFPAVYASLL